MPHENASGTAAAIISKSLAIATLLLSACVVRAEVVDIRWTVEGRFEHKTAVAAGKFVEICGKLPAGLKVGWDFHADVPLDFNLHYHVGKDVMFPSRLSAVTNARNVLDAKLDQDYCWMWTNKAGKSAQLLVNLQRE